MTGVLGPDQVRAWFDELYQAFSTKVDELTEMDRQAGDGDFGLNMGVALDRIQSGLAELEEPEAAEQLRRVTRVFADNGGSSGPLLSAVFRELTRAVTSAGLDLPGLARAFQAGNERIQALGGARVGDSTMIDALDPGAASLLASVDAKRSLSSALTEAARAARTGADSTGSMTARRGRASYVGDRSHGVQDPGAVFVALMFEALERASQSA